MVISAYDIPEFDALRRNPSEDALRLAIKTAQSKFPADPKVTACLAEILADSGQKLTPKAKYIADVASTGGPSSLSTLISPLFLIAAGAIVPKLGVPGRPAGGIDCLAQIPGYRFLLSKKEVLSVLESGGYAHFLASGEFAPLDDEMFRLRQVVGSQAVPCLVVASLLAKKLAVGVRLAGLDVRVAPHGNFGGDWMSASSNARLFLDTANLLGIKAVPVLTDARYPYQPYLGRSEALVALYDYFEGIATEWLEEHWVTCQTLALACLPDNLRNQAAFVTRSDLQRHFEQNLRDQGADPLRCYELVESTRKKHKSKLIATHDGFCNYLLSDIRNALVEWQKESIVDNFTEFPDPVGIVFHQRAGTFVEKGAILATVRAPEPKISDILRTLSPLICTPLGTPFGPGIEAING